MGPVQSNAACKYTNATGVPLNADCPPQCALLLRAVWGDCYCKEPSYLPKTGDAPINSFTTFQMFSFIAEQTPDAVQVEKFYLDLRFTF